MCKHTHAFTPHTDIYVHAFVFFIDISVVDLIVTNRLLFKNCVPLNETIDSRHQFYLQRYLVCALFYKTQLYYLYNLLGLCTYFARNK